VLLPRPREWLKRWALELALLERDAAAQLAALEETLERAGPCSPSPWRAAAP
jgi:hypothetical protein